MTVFYGSSDYLQRENKNLKEQIKEYQKSVDEVISGIMDLQQRINKAIEILKDTSVDMPSTLLIETIDFARHILGGK